MAVAASLVLLVPVTAQTRDVGEILHAQANSGDIGRGLFIHVPASNQKPTPEQDKKNSSAPDRLVQFVCAMDYLAKMLHKMGLL